MVHSDFSEALSSWWKINKPTFLTPTPSACPELDSGGMAPVKSGHGGERSHALGVQNSPPTRTVRSPVGERVFLPVYILSRTGMSSEGATPGGTLTTPKYPLYPS